MNWRVGLRRLSIVVAILYLAAGLAVSALFALNNMQAAPKLFTVQLAQRNFATIAWTRHQAEQRVAAYMAVNPEAGAPSRKNPPGWERDDAFVIPQGPLDFTERAERTQPGAPYPDYSAKRPNAWRAVQNFAYAFQWWVLGVGFLAASYFGVRWVILGFAGGERGIPAKPRQ